MRPTTISLASVLVGAAVVLTACGSDGDATAAPVGPDAQAETETETEDGVVTVERSRYAPEELVVAAGAEVTFENLDPFAHTVTSAEASSVSFDSGELGEGEAFTQRFDAAGTYDYFCVIHPTMRATVVVE